MDKMDGSFTILLVEDDPGDAGLVMAAVAEGRFMCKVEHAQDGIDALQRLRRSDRENLPDLILLDLNMPRMNGHELLAELKADSALTDIPVVVLSTSEGEGDITACYAKGASGYVSKPVDVDALFTAIRGIQEYWFGLVRRPTH